MVVNIQTLGLIFSLLFVSAARADVTIENLRPTGDTAEWRQNLSD